VVRSPLANLLEAWRDAERRWAETTPDSPGYDDATAAALKAFLRYEAASGRACDALFIMDTTRVFRAVDLRLTALLGYRPEEIVGRRVSDLIARTSYGGNLLWSIFLRCGQLEGRSELLRANGSLLDIGFTARAHHPIPGFHSTRLWPLGEAGPRACVGNADDRHGRD
jgi:PAS domain-containing protein